MTFVVIQRIVKLQIGQHSTIEELVLWELKIKDLIYMEVWGTTPELRSG